MKTNRNLHPTLPGGREGERKVVVEYEIPLLRQLCSPLDITPL